MESKNSKSESYIIKEAENIIEEYLEKREMSDIQSYLKLKQKYERLKILTVAISITSIIGIMFNII